MTISITVEVPEGANFEALVQEAFAKPEEKIEAHIIHPGEKRIFHVWSEKAIFISETKRLKND